jgi:hypothetical protein
MEIGEFKEWSRGITQFGDGAPEENEMVQEASQDN